MSVMSNHASVVLPAHPPAVMPEDSYSGTDQNSDLTLNPDFALVRNDYSVQLANEGHPLHAEASNLVTSMYDSRGLGTAQPSHAVGPPENWRREQVTLAASRGPQVLGTLTLGVDSGNGLLADSLYRPEIKPLRQQGHLLCEVTRLAFDPAVRNREVMATLFHVAFVLASVVHERTDLFAEVHPRHAGFYQHTMGYQIAGPERICPRVGAPAVLMHLPLDFARRQIHQLAGTCTQQDRNLYRLFLPSVEQELMLKNLVVPDSAII